MTLRRTLASGAAAVALTLSASAHAQSAPTEARFDGTRSLVVDFAESIQTWDNPVGGSLIALQPDLPRSCHWASDTRLACRFDRDAAKATHYRIDVPGLKTQQGTALPAQVLFAETPRPSVSASVHDWQGGMPVIELQTNMPVAPQELRSALRLSIDDVPFDVPLPTLLPRSWGGNAYYRLDLPTVDGANRIVRLDVLPQLRSLAGPLPGTQKGTLLKLLANEPFQLRSLACRQRGGDHLAVNRNGTVTAQCLPGMPIRLEFSRPLSDKARNWFAQYPPVGWKVAGEQHWWPNVRAPDRLHRAGGSSLVIEAENPQHAYDLVLDALQAADGTRLAPVRIGVQTGKTPPQLRAAHTSALLADPARVPALVESINADARIDVDAVGTGDSRQTVRVRNAGDSVANPVRSSAARRALAQGGWTRWVPALEADERARGQWFGPVQFAAPAFDLYAVHGLREVLVWANEWERDAAVAGADVELLLREADGAKLRVVARGTTGADGVALLRLPDDVTLPQDNDRLAQSMWLVRASDARGRAVLPLGASSQWMRLGQRLDRVTWGVSDRPMYHAGDTVRYRLWQRDRNGDRLQAIGDVAPLALRLQDEGEDKTVLQWQASPSQAGDVAGELQLPRHLTDGTYCIGREGFFYTTDGACFFVGTYRAQDLWAQLESPGGVLRDGQRLVAALKAGYYSGGAAAGVDISRLQVAVEPMAFTEAYPQHLGYEFIDPFDDAYDSIDVEVSPLGDRKDASEQLDREGSARLQATMPSKQPSRPPFGSVVISAEVAPDGREGTVAIDSATRYARYPAFVGLRTDPAWPDARSPIELHGIVVDAHGRALDDAAITVDIDFVPGRVGKAERIGQCTLHAGRGERCDFRRPGNGLYRFTARSGDAAPTQVEFYLWPNDSAVVADIQEPELTVATPTDPAAPLHATLRQPFARGRALFVFSSHDRIDGHRVEPVTGNVREFELVAPADRVSQRLQVFVRSSASEAARVNDGFRTPAKVVEAEASLQTVDDAIVASPVSVRFEPVRSAPGVQARLVLHNDSDTARDVVVSVMDDALRSLAQRWLDYADPHGDSLLGRLKRPRQLLGVRGFDDFADESPWRSLLPWPDEPDSDGVEPAKPLAAPAAAAPPPPEEPPVVVDEPAPLDGFAESTVLDRIEVTGSRIRAVDLESREAKAPDPGLRPREDGQEAGADEVRALARVRTRFADTAAWHPELRLAPGETRTIEITLPDNLTRWRAVAWSSDAHDGFAMAEATLETGLPLEARLQAPVRLYPGDQSQLVVHVRQHGEHPTQAEAMLQFQGTDAPAERRGTMSLEAKGQSRFASVIAPQHEGLLTVVARASANIGGDAVAQPIEVASPRIAARKTLAGWIGETPLALDVPALPAGASDARVDVSIQHGVAGLVDDWTVYMQAYPHRCWEQILSRAVAAALALQRGDKRWGDAEAVVREALDNAAVFQQGNGGFRYFTGGDAWSGDSSVVLTAYTVEAFALLRRLGHPVDADIEQHAKDFLAKVAKPAVQPAGDVAGASDALVQFAYAAAARHDVAAVELDPLWQRWDRLPLPAQVATARALAVNGHPAAQEATKRLVAVTATRGPARVLRLPRRHDEWMSSSLREQCSLIALFGEQPRLDADKARPALIAGLTDLYAGGGVSVDTQSGATCLMALSDDAGQGGDGAAVDLELGTARGRLQLDPGQRAAKWSAPLEAATQLRMAAGPSPAAEVPTSFVAEMHYQEDARMAQPSAIGLAIGRRYEVFRNGEWRPVGRSVAVRTGDWVRITLTIDNSAPRRFVAVTDQAPGGLRPTDLSLSGVVVRDIQRASSTGSTEFATRRLDARAPKFYAEYLSPGRHEVHYFAVAGNAGDYLAAPAVAELMYGGASSARTASARLQVLGNAP
ncbi:alpha-2-macroglobulin family protein [Lysobacter niastensis]|uniref:Alpha-2-macroglobulin domain-containing protein n=1 Tax=Lysobacter niastensis TaxID=380629 RepID=A0ABS0B487_9GAMM|nr:alpha-2-macroglobulin family protein [Lysobacter niastensis]MBF6023375.1 hypothetical protein [Lysobacter niastensis]